MKEIQQFVPTVARFIPLCTLRKRDEGVQGYYIAAAGIGAGWRGAVAMHSLDQGQNWKPVATVKRESVMGRIVDMEPSGEPSEWMIKVMLLHAGMTLESRSFEEVEAGANRMLVGSEVISFGNAKLVAGLTYELTDIHRGRRGTTQAGQHVGQAVTMLDEQSLARVDALDAVSRAGIYTVCSFGQKVIDEPPQSFEQFQGGDE
jgi:hypothetical protein